jgi:hypothetical protein
MGVGESVVTSDSHAAPCWREAWEKNKSDEQAGKRLTGLEDWARNAGRDALLF